MFLAHLLGGVFRVVASVPSSYCDWPGVWRAQILQDSFLMFFVPAFYSPSDSLARLSAAMNMFDGRMQKCELLSPWSVAMKYIIKHPFISTVSQSSIWTVGLFSQLEISLTKTT